MLAVSLSALIRKFDAESKKETPVFLRLHKLLSTLPLFLILCKKQGGF